MSNDWWPKPLAHIPREDPWAQDPVVVAEVKSFDEQPLPGHRQTVAALVPIDQIDVVKEALAEFDHEVSASGPHPFFMKDRAYEPQFWIEAGHLPEEGYEPLVLSWSSHHTTVLHPDAGFLMTYGLTPRPGGDGIVYWDDPKTPRRGIVTVSPVSVWEAPLGTRAYVSIARDFLQDYLTIRRMALVQVFWELRWAAIDAEIQDKLGREESISVEFADRHYQLNRHITEHDTICAQVWVGV